MISANPLVSGVLAALIAPVIIAAAVHMWRAVESGPKDHRSSGVHPSSPTDHAGPPGLPSHEQPTNPAGSSPPADGFTAKVAWTDDGGPTTLYAFAGPNSHVHKGQYLLNEPMTVMCQAPGRPITVGTGYKGPSPTSAVWYRLDLGTWMPAVYLDVNDAGSVPACT